MDVLLTNNHLIQPGGSETFTYTIAEELKRRGYNVEVFTCDPGLLTFRFNVPIRHKEPSKDRFDLILANHVSCLATLSYVEGIKIQTCHGKASALEQPWREVDAHVVISEELQDHLKKKGYNPILIRNGIDCERFKPVNPIKDKATRVFCLPQTSQAQKMVAEACMKMGYEFHWTRQEWDIERRMNEADIVVSLGRGILEGMACGRAVVVFDVRGYQGPRLDGMVTEENWEQLAWHNFSGRSGDRLPTVNAICEEFLKYRPEMGEVNRQIALKNFNVKDQVDHYLELYEECSKTLKHSRTS